MKFAAVCKIDRAVSTDPTRTHLNRAHLDVENKVIVATDGHAMARVPVEVEEGDETGWVTVEALQAARKAAGKRGDVNIHANGALAIAGGPTFPRPGQDGCNFPPYQQVIPTYADGDLGVLKFGISMDILVDLARAIGVNDSKGKVLELTIKVTGENGAQVPRLDQMHDPILVRTGAHNGALGVLMPVRV